MFWTYMPWYLLQTSKSYLETINYTNLAFTIFDLERHMITFDGMNIGHN